MSSKHFNDDEIQNILKTYQPVAPPAPKSLLNTILLRMGLEKKQTNYRSMWISLASGLASCVLVFALIDRQFAAQFNTEPTIEPSAAVAVMLEEEEDEVITSLDSPSMSVGEDYLNLVSR